MPFSNGTFTIINTFVGGTTILSSQVNQNYSDIATGLSTCILKDGTQTITATIPFSLASTGAVPVQLVSTNADGVVGPILELYRNSASPVNNDDIGGIDFYGKDSAAGKIIYARDKVNIADQTTTQVDGIRAFMVTVAGVLTDKLRLVGAALYPTADDGLALGTASLGYSDLYLAAGAFMSQSSGEASGRVDKNGSNQAVASTAATKVTFGTERFDIGAHFASSTLTPPAGRVSLYASAGIQLATGAVLSIYKNGGAIAISRTSGTVASADTVTVAIIDECNGTDTYEIYVQDPADASYNVLGTTTLTYFCWSMV